MLSSYVDPDHDSLRRVFIFATLHPASDNYETSSFGAQLTISDEFGDAGVSILAKDIQHAASPGARPLRPVSPLAYTGRTRIRARRRMPGGARTSSGPAVGGALRQA